MTVARSLAFGGIALALQACGGALVRSDWLAHPTHPPLEPRHFEVADADLGRVCGHTPGATLYGCAVRLVAERSCIIYTGPRPAAWLIEHERKHCAGWDHGPPVVVAGS